jgi:hypothetical protein
MSDEIKVQYESYDVHTRAGKHMGSFQIGHGGQGFHDRLLIKDVQSSETIEERAWSPPIETFDQALMSGRLKLSAWSNEQDHLDIEREEREAKDNMPLSPEEQQRMQAALNNSDWAGGPHMTPTADVKESELQVPNATPDAPGFEKKGVATPSVQSYQPQPVNPTVQEARDRAAHTPPYEPPEPE